MSEAEPAKDVPKGSVFGFTGRISSKRYWAQVAGALAVLVLGIVFLAIASDPRGSSDPALLVPVSLVLFVWLLAAAMTQRLRDAGRPPVLVLGFIILLLGVLFLGVELMDVAPFVGPLGFVGILVFVGHIDAFLKRRADPA